MMTPAEFIATRKRLGLTQAELAVALGASRRTIVSVESGVTPNARLYDLALRGLEAEMATTVDSR